LHGLGVLVLLLVRPESLTAPLSNREDTQVVENTICVFLRRQIGDFVVIWGFSLC
jgi:hypothetical protein